MNYNAFASTFTRLISKYDQRTVRIVLRKNRAGAIDPLTGLFVAGTIINAPIRAVTLNYTTNQVDGVLIRAGDIQVLMDNAVAPEMSDYVVIDGQEYSLVAPILTHNVGGVVMGYTIQVRR